MREEINLTDLDKENLFINLKNINEEIEKLKFLKKALDENVFNKQYDILDYKETYDFFDKEIRSKQNKFQNYLIKYNKNLRYISYREKIQQLNIANNSN